MHNKYIPDLFLIRYDIKDIFPNVSNYWMLKQEVCCFKIWKLNFSQVKWLRNHIRFKKKKVWVFLTPSHMLCLRELIFFLTQRTLTDTSNRTSILLFCFEPCQYNVKKIMLYRGLLSLKHALYSNNIKALCFHQQ